VYKELSVEIKDADGVELPVSERLNFCKAQLGEEASVRGEDSTKTNFICEVANTETAKKPTEVCQKTEKYRLLEDGFSFVCYSQGAIDATPATLYCPSGYVKNSCTETYCTCSRTVTVKAYEKYKNKTKNRTKIRIRKISFFWRYIRFN